VVDQSEEEMILVINNVKLKGVRHGFS